MTDFPALFPTLLALLSTEAFLRLLSGIISWIAKKGDQRRADQIEARTLERDDQRHFYEQVLHDYQYFREESRKCEEARRHCEQEGIEMRGEMYVLKMQFKDMQEQLALKKTNE